MLTVVGRLGIDGRCLTVTEPNGERYNVVWPSPGTEWDAETQTVSVGAETATVGDEVTLIGGPGSWAGAEGVPNWVSIASVECISDEQWLVSSLEADG
jgi:hypothetical protein